MKVCQLVVLAAVGILWRMYVLPMHRPDAFQYHSCLENMHARNTPAHLLVNVT